MIVPLTGLPEGVVGELEEAAGPFTLVGAHARDYWVHDVCGMPRPALTQDVDIAILVPSFASYRERLASLDGPVGTGLVFRVAGVLVDIIPFGPELAPDGIIEPVPGVTLDVTGMAESVETAVLVPSVDRSIRVPSLAAMIGLKLIAWGYRHDSTPKDARDLGPLLTATYRGPFADRVWSDQEACDRWGYDDLVLGPYLAGRDLGSTWRPGSQSRLRETLLPSRIPELATQIARYGAEDPHVRSQQLEALAAGLVER